MLLKKPLLLIALLFVAFGLSLDAQQTTESPQPLPRKSNQEIKVIPPTKEELIIRKTDIPPMFPGCEQHEDLEQRKACSNLELVKFIYANLRYPGIARENRVEGTIVVQVIIEKDGRLISPKVIRDIGAGCGEEGMRVVSKMPIWHPGIREGETVPMLFNLPMKFKLE